MYTYIHFSSVCLLTIFCRVMESQEFHTTPHNTKRGFFVHPSNQTSLSFTDSLHYFAYYSPYYETKTFRTSEKSYESPVRGHSTCPRLLAAIRWSGTVAYTYPLGSAIGALFCTKFSKVSSIVIYIAN